MTLIEIFEQSSGFTFSACTSSWDQRVSSEVHIREVHSYEVVGQLGLYPEDPFREVPYPEVSCLEVACPDVPCLAVSFLVVPFLEAIHPEVGY